MGKEISKKQIEIIKKLRDKLIEEPLSSEPHVELYFGSRAKANEMLPNSIPIVQNGESRMLSLQKFQSRCTPAYLGMLAEIEMNPDITLDELMDTQSENARNSKKVAGSRLEELLPKKDKDGKIIFDYDKFRKFVNDNTEKLVTKVEKLYEQMDNMNLYEKHNFFNKYSPLLEGLSDGYNQSFVTKEFLKDDYSKKEYMKLFNRTQYLWGEYDAVSKAVNSIKGLYSSMPEEGFRVPASDQVIYFSSPSYISRDELKKLKTRNPDVEKDYKELFGYFGKTAEGAGLGYTNFSNDKVGMLGQLSDFERMVLAVDPAFTERIKINFTTNNKNEVKAYTMTYTDDRGRQLSLHSNDSPEEFSAENLAVIKTELYNHILSDENYAELEPDVKKEMQDFLKLTPAQKIAEIQCRSERDRAQRYQNSLSKAKAEGAALPDDYKKVYDDLSKNVEKLTKAFDKVMKEPLPYTKEELEKALSDTLTASVAYREYCKNAGPENIPESHKKLNENISALVRRYNSKKDDLEFIVSEEARDFDIKNSRDNIINQISLGDAYSTETIAEKILSSSKKPKDISMEEYKAACIGALLSDDIIGQIKLSDAEGELKNERLWTALIKNVLVPDETKKDTIDNEKLLKATGEKVEAAMSKLREGDRTELDKYIKTFTDASIRLYDKSDLYKNTTEFSAFKRDMLGVSATITASEEHKGISNLGASIRARRTVGNNIASVLENEKMSTLNVLTGGIKTPEQRSEAVLNLLTATYVKLKGADEAREAAGQSDMLVKLALEKKGIKDLPEMAGDQKLADAGAVLSNLYENTHFSDLEANFTSKERRDNFVNKLHEEIKKTKLYELLMESDTALEDMAINGESAEILTADNFRSLMDIGYLRTAQDIKNKTFDREYEAEINARLPKLGQNYLLAKRTEEIVKEEINSRPEIDFTKPVFVQFAPHIAKSLKDNSAELVELGYPKEKLDELVGKIEKYHSDVDALLVENKDGHINEEFTVNVNKYKNQLDEIGVLFNDLFQNKIELADSPLELIGRDLGFYAVAKDGLVTRRFRDIIKDSVAGYNNDRNTRLYGDDLSTKNMAENVYTKIADITDKLKKSKPDQELAEEFKSVVRGAEYLKNVVHKISTQSGTETISREDHKLYKEARKVFAGTLTEYLKAAKVSASDSKKLVKDAVRFLNDTRERVDEIEHNLNREQVFNATNNVFNNKEKVSEKALSSALNSKTNYKEDFDRKYNNYYQVFGAKKPEGDGWPASLAKKGYDAKNDYDPKILEGVYTDKELALITAILASSPSFQNMSEENMMLHYGSNVYDIFKERTDASGDAPLVEMVEKARGSMNTFMKEMKEGNYENLAKYFNEGLNFVITNMYSNGFGSSEEDASILKIGKDYADLLDKHPELKKITEKKVNGEREFHEENMEYLKGLQKFAPIVDEFKESFQRVKDYLKKHSDRENVSIEADSQIANDIAIVSAYNRLDFNAAMESSREFDRAEEAIDEEVKKIESPIEQGKEKLRLFTRIKLDYDMSPETFKNTDKESFDKLVTEEKNKLFGKKNKINMSLGDLTGIAGDLECQYICDIVSNTQASSTGFRKPAIKNLHDDVIDAVKLAKFRAPNKKTSRALDKFIKKFDSINDMLKDLQEELKDGSYKKLTKKAEAELKASYKELGELAKKVKSSYSRDNVATKKMNDAFDNMQKSLNKAIKSDTEALEKGTLFGSTELRNKRKHLDDINDIYKDLAKSKVFGDKSSPEFKDLLNSLSSLGEESRRRKGSKEFIEKLDKISKNIDEYLRHKQFNNNGSARSKLRIAKVNTLKQYLDDIMPSIKDEAKANSYESRFEKLGYDNSKLGDARSLFKKIETKRKELNKLADDPYKEISKRANEAREVLIEHYFKGDLNKEIPENSKEFTELKKCIAAIALEKRMDLERNMLNDELSPEEKELTRGMTPIFTEKLNSRDENNEITIVKQRRGAALNSKALDAFDNIDHGFVFNLLNPDGEVPEIEDEVRKVNVYDNMINQVVNYKLIKNDMLKPENIINVLKDDDEAVEKLYMNTIHNAVEKSQKANKGAASKEVAPKAEATKLEAPKLS